ncbi:MAG: STAS domain-containing protein [Burkholderiales bacterium]
MALFNKPPAKKPEPPPAAKAPAGPAAARAPASARDIAAQAQGRRGAPEAPRAEPGADISMTGASLIEWSPNRNAIEVGQSNPGLCSVLENAALLYASGQAKAAREMLEQGVVSDPDANASQLAWLALFDLQQRADDRVAFDRMALVYAKQFERSPPVWEESGKQPALQAKVPGGYALLAGKLTAATAPQLEGVRKQMAKPGQQMRLDLAQVQGFDDAGARLLADLLAEARRKRYAVKLERHEKIQHALDILVRRGREAGESAWLLSLEFLQFANKQEAFDDRAIEYAVAFEQSPPSWEPPPVPAAPVAGAAGAAGAEPSPAPAAQDATPNTVAWTGALTGPSPHAINQLLEGAMLQSVVVLDLARVERIDFVCAGSMLNAINRVEQQRKAVQIHGASPIVRALLLLIGISPRHFLKKAQ